MSDNYLVVHNDTITDDQNDPCPKLRVHFLIASWIQSQNLSQPKGLTKERFDRKNNKKIIFNSASS